MVDWSFPVASSSVGVIYLLFVIPDVLFVLCMDDASMGAIMTTIVAYAPASIRNKLKFRSLPLLLRSMCISGYIIQFSELSSRVSSHEEMDRFLYNMKYNNVSL